MNKLACPIARTGSGNTAILAIRVLVDTGGGMVQQGTSITTRLQNKETEITLTPEVTLALNVGDLVAFEFIRDSQGINEGDLTAISLTDPNWTDSPSAKLTVSRPIKAY